MPPQHLQRLNQVWVPEEVYFITTCTQGRRPFLACPEVLDLFEKEMKAAPHRHGWKVGRFMIMPDHLHFFCAPVPGQSRNLSAFMGAFKQWTSKQLRDLKVASPLIWQPEYFDHLLRSSESYSEKWVYVRENPVRAGLTKRSEDWPWQGEVEPFFL